MAIGTSETLFADIAHGIVGSDAETGEVLAVNDAFCDLVGSAERELIGTDLAAVTAASSPLVGPVFRQARTESARIEWRLRTRCEGVIPVEGRLTITEQDGREVALASVARREPDATERNPVEADATGLDALETGEESAVGDERWPSGFQRHRDRYRTLFENEDLVLWEQDFSAAREYATELADTGEELGAHIDEHPEELLEILARMDVHMVNDAALDFYGVESKTQLVENFDEMMVPDTCEGLTEMWKAVVDGQRYFCTECKFRPLDGTTTTLTAQFPRGTAFDPVFDALGDRYGEVRTADYTTEPADPDAAGDPLSGLTDRQREVLEAAVRAGYFERPRGLNATEMADRLGVSRQAFQQVLRAAQRNAFAELFPTE